MKEHSEVKNILICLLLIFFLSGCTQPNATGSIERTLPFSQPSQPATETKVGLVQSTATLPPPETTPTQLATPLPTITNTLMPTLDPMAREEKVKQLLRIDQTCRLPCSMGVIPGESKWIEVEREFSEMGFRWGKPFAARGSEGQLYDTSMGDVSTPFNLGTFMLVNEDLIDGIIIGIAGPDILISAPDYYISNLIQSLGDPSRVWMDSDYREGMPRPVFTFWIFYDERGIAIRYYVIGTLEGDTIKICPKDPNRFEPNPQIRLYGENLYLQHPENPRKLEDLIGITGEKIPNLPDRLDGASGYSIEEIADLTPNEFYRMGSEQNYQECFNTRVDIWGGK